MVHTGCIDMCNENIDLEKLEDAHFTFGKNAFNPKSMNCQDCCLRMKKVSLRIKIGKNYSNEVKGFRCPKCKKESLGLIEASKIKFR